MVSIERINISDHVDTLEQAIKDECNIKKAQGYNLASSFTYQTQLILIFQKP